MARGGGGSVTVRVVRGRPYGVPVFGEIKPG
jgi:hypothetical protein